MSADDGLRALFVDHLRKPEWALTPIETGGTHQGVPDLHWTNRPGRRSGWVECKATSGWAVKLEPHQVGWLTVHSAAGDRCTIAVRARGLGSAMGRGDALWIVRGSAAAELQRDGLRLDDGHIIARWLGPPKSWDWEALGLLLQTTDD